MTRAHRGPTIVGLLFLSMTIPSFAEPGIPFHPLGNSAPYVSRGYDVSADGSVVVGTNELSLKGSGLIVEEAFRWTVDTGQTPLGFLDESLPATAAYGVSSDGAHAVGRSLGSPGQQAALWSGTSSPVGLGFLVELSESEAVAVSQAGEYVAGTNAFDPGGTPLPPFRRAFRWSAANGMEDLGGFTLTGDSAATDISRLGGVVVGRASPPIPPDSPFIREQTEEAMIWTETGGMVGLGHFPYKPTDVPHAYLSSESTAVSAGGDYVVGTSAMVSLDGHPDLFHRGFRWNATTGLEDLGDLHTDVGRFEYDPVDISADGQIVVGNATLVTTEPLYTEAFVWTAGNGMEFLADYLRNEFSFETPQGWDLGLLSAISDDGTTLVGTGTNPTGHQEGWRLRMQTVSEPNALALLCIGALALMTIRR